MSKELEALRNIGAIFVSYICNEDGNIDYCHLRDDNEYSNWYNTVYQALKRNEPMKPIYEKDGTRSCPCCKANWLTPNFKFCSDCGQKLKWSNEEEHY